MKKLFLTSVLTAAAGVLFAAEKTADVEKAAKALGDKPNYSWTAKTESSQQNRQGGGDREGKIEKNGFAAVSMTVRDDQVQAVINNKGKAVIKSGESWQTADSLAENEDQENRRMRGLARQLQTFKAPHAEAADLAKTVKELKKGDDNVYSGEITPAGLKELVGRGFGRRGGGGEGPDLSNIKGTAKFWVKDGVLSKYSTRVEGQMKFGERDVEIDRTTTVEIKEVGSTKVSVPEDAKSKLSS